MNLSQIFLVGLGAVLAIGGVYVIFQAPTDLWHLGAGLVLVVVGVTIILKKDITIS